MGNVCISNRTLTPMEHGTFEYVLPPELIKAEVSTDLVEVQEKCATKIQAVYRGHSVRKLQKEVQESYVPPKSVAEETELVPDVHHHVVSKVLLQLGPFDWEKCDQMPGAQTLKPHKFVEQGGIYIGQWKDHKRNGRGQYVYPDGSLYEGFWQNDKANGFGRLVMTSGEYYVGQWKDDKMDGYGVYVHADQSKYEGQWKEDQRHGKGKEIWADDSAVYEGDFVMGVKEGVGTYKWGDKSSYNGQFKGGQFNGYGEYIWADDSKYAGQWQKNKMNGEGEMTWSDGRHYKGSYKDNKKDGYGEFTWPDKRVYKGMWLNGLQHGEGVQIDKYGKQVSGEWHEGQRR